MPATKTRTKRTVFDFLHSPAKEVAAEIVRRNEDANASYSGMEQPDVCLICNKAINKGQRYWRATSKRSAHESCVISHLPGKSKGKVTVETAPEPVKTKTVETPAASVEAPEEQEDLSYKVGYLQGQNDTHLLWLEKLERLLKQ